MLFNLFNLLAEAEETAGEVVDSTNKNDTGNPYMTWIIMGVAIALIIVMMVFSRRSQQKKQDELKATLDAIQPGNKVKTIGGICGVVVEVCKEDNTFILETGSEASGKSYIKLDKQSVYQTDAKSAPAEEKVEAPVEAPAPAETAPEAPAETAAPVETAPEAPAETVAPVETAPEATEEKAE